MGIVEIALQNPGIQALEPWYGTFWQLVGNDNAGGGGASGNGTASSVRSSARWFEERQGAHELGKCPTQVDEMNTTTERLSSVVSGRSGYLLTTD